MLSFLTKLASLFGWRRRPRPAPAPDPTLPAQVIRVQYGSDPQQFIDLHLPERRASELVPAVEFVHGGGWQHGAADSDNVVANKVPWLNSQGIAFCSVSYPLGVASTPPVDPYNQAVDVALAFAFLRANGRQYGINPDRIARMGHSAGAHLSMLVNTTPALAKIAGPYLGAISLDSAALDVLKIMENPLHDALYDLAFGDDPAYWLLCSPQQQLQVKIPSVLLVYSEQRGPANRSSTIDFAAKAATFGTDVNMLGLDLSHGEINSTLGLPGAYTGTVNEFLDSLGLASRA